MTSAERRDYARLASAAGLIAALTVLGWVLVMGENFVR